MRFIVHAAPQLQALVEVDPDTGDGKASCGTHTELIGPYTAGSATWNAMRVAGATNPPPIAVTIEWSNGRAQIQPVDGPTGQEFQPAIIPSKRSATPVPLPSETVGEAIDVVVKAALANSER